MTSVTPVFLEKLSKFYQSLQKLVLEKDSHNHNITKDIVHIRDYSKSTKRSLLECTLLILSS